MGSPSSMTILGTRETFSFFWTLESTVRSSTWLPSSRIFRILLKNFYAFVSVTSLRLSRSILSQIRLMVTS
jgi:hypothetical protein